MIASQINRRAAPVKRERRDRSSATSKRPGRARLGGVECGHEGADTVVCVACGVSVLIGLRDATAESDGVGKMGVEGVSGGVADAGGRVSSSDTEGEVGVTGGGGGGGVLCTLLIVLTVCL